MWTLAAMPELGVVFWIVIGVIVVGSMFFRYLSSASRDRTLRDLAERGQTISPDMFARNGGRGGSVGGGLFFLFIGLAVGAFLWAMNSGFGGSQPVGPAWLPFVALFPIAIGLSMLLGGLIGGGRNGRD